MKKLTRLFWVLSLAAIMISVSADASTKPLALVWTGAGACRPGCVAGATHMAKLAGFDVQNIDEKTTDFSSFNTAKLWMTPGGYSVNEAEAMGPVLVNRIREFVAEGGGYVGFCAGAFFSTSKIGTSDTDGAGIVPGTSSVYVTSGNDHHVFDMTLADGSTRWMYYAGGPYFNISDDQLQAANGQVTARYPDGSIAGVNVHYGLGKVSVIGTHPEAGFWWKFIEGQHDADGLDYDIAVKMIQYATSPDASASSD
jgi:glutamine amidotransferase-like uncharacterized protein